MRVLLVEDSERLQRSLSKALRKDGYAVDFCGDGEDGLWRGQSGDYDAIVLDIMLPKMDGLAVLKKMRDEGNLTPILLLTARDAVDDRVRGLRLGADDYLVKPFALAELLARVQVLCRRRYGARSNLIRVVDIQIDTTARTVTRSDHTIDLTAREFALLEYLARRSGQVVSRSEIEAHIYGEGADVMSNAVDSAICVLRRKLGETEHAPIIQTRRGFGYVLMGAAA